MPYEMLNNIIDIYKYIYVMDVYNREAFSNLHIGKNGADCYSKNGHAVTVLTVQS